MSLVYSVEQLFHIKNSPLVKKPDRLPDGIGFESTKVDYNKMHSNIDVCDKERITDNIEIFNTEGQKVHCVPKPDKIPFGSDSTFMFFSSENGSRTKNFNSDDGNNLKKVIEYESMGKPSGYNSNFSDFKNSESKINDENRINLMQMTQENCMVIDKNIFKDDKEFIEENKNYKHKTHICSRDEKCRDCYIFRTQKNILSFSDKTKIHDAEAFNSTKMMKNDCFDNNEFSIDMENDINRPNIFDKKKLENCGDLNFINVPEKVANSDVYYPQKMSPLEYERNCILDSNERLSDNFHGSSESRIVNDRLNSVHLSNSIQSPLKYSDVNSNKTSRFFNFFANDSIKSKDVEKLNTGPLLYACSSNELENKDFLSTEYTNTGLIHEQGYTHEGSQISSSRTYDDVIGFQRIMDMLKRSNQLVSKDHLVSHNYEVKRNEVIYDKNNECCTQAIDNVTKHDPFMNKESSDSIFFLSLLNQSSRRLSSLHIGLENDNTGTTQVYNTCDGTSNISKYDNQRLRNHNDNGFSVPFSPFLNSSSNNSYTRYYSEKNHESSVNMDMPQTFYGCHNNNIIQSLHYPPGLGFDEFSYDKDNDIK
ncbi:hypothetical protein PORY_001098 [Pneumocystis oryctolagi]|uniref:Uncharacterized protein n=1 Tax=Pneumocystis oryctolagi TaxID=42067 RepID=A0ACB7CEN9_9ASCO|nr:hypothetical protein PORY_001098 [Pneumocystis oryctolagi]